MRGQRDKYSAFLVGSFSQVYISLKPKYQFLQWADTCNVRSPFLGYWGHPFNDAIHIHVSVWVYLPHIDMHVQNKERYGFGIAYISLSMLHALYTSLGGQQSCLLSQTCLQTGLFIQIHSVESCETYPDSPQQSDYSGERVLVLLSGEILWEPVEATMF